MQVKGLDYALLQKVKSEMDEVMEDDEDEADPVRSTRIHTQTSHTPTQTFTPTHPDRQTDKTHTHTLRAEQRVFSITRTPFREIRSATPMQLLIWACMSPVHSIPTPHVPRLQDAAIATSDRNRLLAAAKVRAASVSAQAATAAAAAAAEAESGDRVVCRSRVAQGVYNTLFQSDASRKKHELFQPGRMAYLGTVSGAPHVG